MKELKTPLLLIAVAAVGIAASFLYLQNSQRQARKAGTLENICSQFEQKEGEITCEEAKTIALKEFPGEAAEISRKQMDFAQVVGKQSSYDLWLVTIQLDQPIQRQDGTVKNAVVAGVDATDGKLKYSALQ